MELGKRFHVEVGFGSGPIIIDFGEQSGHESEEGLRIGEDAGDSGSAFNFLAEPLCGIGGAHSLTMLGRKDENGEAFGDVGFEPMGKLWG